MLQNLSQLQHKRLILMVWPSILMEPKCMWLDIPMTPSINILFLQPGMFRALHMLQNLSQLQHKKLFQWMLNLTQMEQKCM